MMNRNDKAGNQIIDDFSSQGSYMHKIGDNESDITSQQSVMMRAGGKGTH